MKRLGRRRGGGYLLHYKLFFKQEAPVGKEQLELFWEIFLLLTPPAATPVYTERKGGDWMSKNPPPLPCYARGILENVINSPPPHLSTPRCTL